MSKKIPSKLAGRAVADEKGNQTWVWDSDGENVDTAVVRALGGELTLEGPATPAKSHGSNPYDRGGGMTPGDNAGDKTPAKRRTLDDMRKLSESIKRNKRTT
jgi:hypothetical protein